METLFLERIWQFFCPTGVNPPEPPLRVCTGHRLRAIAAHIRHGEGI